jgi:phenylacetyl-CoA:acceptor oxidoreductase subunit 2
MNASVLGKVAPWRQAYWDWRAAGNFIGGGSGAGALVCAAVEPSSAAGLTLIGLLLVGCGLLCVWLEIGRPWRALNVFLHPQSSWMTREALVAPLLFAGGAAGLWTGSRPLLAAVAGAACLYAYCQARMLHGGRGIPAWRHPRVVPLLMATAVAEGAGLGVAVTLALHSGAPSIRAVALLGGLVVVRTLVYAWYRRGLVGDGAPRRALDVLSGFGRRLVAIDAAACGCALIGLVAPTAGWLAGVAALLAVAGGWWLKYTLVVRAAYSQGFALPTTPVRGAGGTHAGSKPGW